MKVLSLNGKWSYQQVKGSYKGSAQVPGDIYKNLLDNNQIPDPFYRDNELELKWIGESDWTFSRTFKVSAKLLEHDAIILKCLGLDTLTTITVNGTEVGKSDNMFRAWEFDVKEALKVGANTIVVDFASAMHYCRMKGEERRLPSWNDYDRNWIRKEQCNFDWDWGLHAVTCGIWRDVELVAYNEACIDDIRIDQTHSPKAVDLSVEVTTKPLNRRVRKAVATVSYDGKTIVTEEAVLKARKGTLNMTVKNPNLWWPNNLGEQPLYHVEVKLFDGEGNLLDTCVKRIGLRTLELDCHADEWGESFQFKVNGHPFFAKGANWIPADAILSRMTEKEYRMLIQGSADANMNMLRVWGGGIYENDVFYDLCDELGICIWQDFMFACATYPTFDKAFMATVKEELQDNIKRLRHHPSIALWCGNNELEQGLVRDEWGRGCMSWKDYSKLFDTMMPKLVDELDPQRNYWPGSPHSPHGDRQDFNNPTCGDAHLWDVWHGKKPFEWYRTCEHRFNSEFGFQSFPEPKTVYGYTEKSDRNITSWVMEHHQRSGTGNTNIMQYMLEWFRLPLGFENTLWSSQILQGMAIKYAVEHWRRSMPRGMGTLYWQLNDCWPVASWASIDYHGRWKALHYMAKDFFAPLLISGLEKPDDGVIEINVTNDLMDAQQVVASWKVTDVAGKIITEGCKKATAKASANTLVHTLNVKKDLKLLGKRNILVWLELTVDGKSKPISDNLVLFSRPKHIELLDPKIKATVKQKGKDFKVTLKAKAPSLWTWLELTKTDATCSTNFVHLRPGKSVIITVTPKTKISLKDFQKQLTVKSLINTY